MVFQVVHVNQAHDERSLFPTKQLDLLLSLDHELLEPKSGHKRSQYLALPCLRKRKIPLLSVDLDAARERVTCDINSHLVLQQANPHLLHTP